MEKNYFIAIRDTIAFIFNHPAVLVFTLLRVILFGLIYIFATYFYPDLQLENLVKNTDIFFQKNCFTVLPCGLLILYGFLAAGLGVGLATSRYVQTVLRQISTINLQAMHFGQNIVASLIWSMLLTPCYFYIFRYFLGQPNVAPLLYFLTPIPLLIMLLVLLPTFFLAPVLTQNKSGRSLRATFASSLGVMRHNFGKTILFILIFYVLAEVAVFVLLNAVNHEQILMQVLIGLGLALLVTIKDVFKTFVAIE